MSNISTAKTSLHAELAHVQSGLAYYQARVEALTAAIDQLDAIGDESDTDLDLEEAMDEPKIRRGRRGRRPGAGAAAGRSGAAGRAGTIRRAAKPAGRRGRASGRMPATGGDFFPNLINEQKQSMSDLLHAAAAQLPFKATDEEMTQLRSRLVAAVNQMLKSGKIRDEGKGRARMYFRD